MGENHRSTRKYSDDIERIVNSLQSVEGILGFSIIDRDYGASIVTLVNKKREIKMLPSTGTEKQKIIF